MKSKHLSMKQLAQQIGVSQPLISMVLNDRWRENRISEQTRDKVLRKLEQLDFRPNKLATSLRSKKTDTVGILVPNIRGEMYQEILSGVESAMGAEFNLHLGVSEYDVPREQALIVSFLERRVDGLIWVLADTVGDQPLLREIVRKRIPLVLVDRGHRDIPAMLVCTDHAKTGSLTAAHFLEKGYKRLCLVSHLPEGRIDIMCMLQDRIRAFEQTARQGGATFELLDMEHDGDFTETARRVISRFAPSREVPTGIYFMQPTLAAAVAAQCMQTGLNVPQDVGVLANEATPDNEYLVMPISTTRQPLRRIGDTAGQLLRDMIAGVIPVDPPQTIQFDAELRPHRSTDRKT